jgi:hypothetical protein
MIVTRTSGKATRSVTKKVKTAALAKKANILIVAQMVK